ncbi:MAG: hypothetical protein P4M11_09920, partial [Candidatus Pacebacteria bacterium]|nr:hypothetical protein [Candidatus Paceibacterota bacterium]
MLASAIAGGVAFAMKNFNSETDLEDYVTDKDYDSTSHPGVCVGIVISGTYPSYAIKLRYDDNNYLDTSDSDYKMQIPTPRLPAYNDLTQLPDETSFHQYRTSGFTFLQYLISQEVLRKHDSSAKIRMGVVPVRTGDYVKDAFLSAAGDFLGIIVVLCYMVPVFRIISIVV